MELLQQITHFVNWYIANLYIIFPTIVIAWVFTDFTGKLRRAHNNRQMRKRFEQMRHYAEMAPPPPPPPYVYPINK